MQEKRKSRFSNYEKSSAREFRLNVYPDGTRIPIEVITARNMLAKQKFNAH